MVHNVSRFHFFFDSSYHVVNQSYHCIVWVKQIKKNMKSLHEIYTNNQKIKICYLDLSHLRPIGKSKRKKTDLTLHHPFFLNYLCKHTERWTSCCKSSQTVPVNRTSKVAKIIKINDKIYCYGWSTQLQKKTQHSWICVYLNIYQPNTFRPQIGLIHLLLSENSGKSRLLYC